ncbi:DUF4003 family protein [Butyrivibrio proteoclasticus]|uniref:DUF4003 family protein n=1 Tax=Butyrivibrio proteoclasticus TaxID=43305 RepID=UPI00047CF3F5|nr:DUF4003 family protein [Butyrivibrio proteoclasticus]
MKNAIEKRIELLIENKNLMQKAFMLEPGLITVVTASALAEKELTADTDHIKECRDLLRKKKNALSYFRGNNELVVSTKMALSSDPEKYLEDITAVYEKLNEGKFLGSSYKVLAAITVVDAGKSSFADEIAEKTKAIMKGMSSKHPFLTNDEDTCLAVLLAMTDKSTSDILEELEDTFSIVKKSFAFHENEAYSLCQVLTTLDGNPASKAERTLELFKAFGEAGTKYGKTSAVVALGTLASLNVNTTDLAEEIIEAAKYLDGKKGFSFLEMSKQTKLMLGAMVVSSVYSAENSVVDASVATNVLATVMMQELMLMIMISSAAASAAASSSSN